MDAHDLINGTALARCAARYASAAANPHSNTSSTTTVERTVEGGLLLASKAGLNLDSASALHVQMPLNEQCSWSSVVT